MGGTTYPHDVFAGSSFYFRSFGYDRIGVVDFSQMLAPVGQPTWASRSRRHHPQIGDEDCVELYNQFWIEFWHRLDVALLEEDLPEMGPEAIGDALWEALFSSGRLVENRGITMTMARLARISAVLEETDQLGMPRPANTLGDVGAIEVD